MFLKTGIFGVINALAGLGYIFTAQNIQVRILRSLISQSFRLLLNRSGSRLILQNKDDFDLFARNRFVDEDKIHLIRGSGVDPNAFIMRSEKEGLPVVVLVSRMLWDKGVKEFIEAVKLLKEGQVKARFVLVGDSDEHNPNAIPRSILQEWANSGIVEWWGQRNDKVEVFARSHVMCLPTYREGLSKVLLEAAV